MADLIFIGQNWECNTTVCQKLVERLSESHRVIWVNCNFFTSFFSPQNAFRKIHQTLTSGPSSESSDRSSTPLLHSVMLLSAADLPLIQKLSEKKLTAEINDLIQQYKLSNPVVFYTQPSIPFLSKLSEPSKDIYFQSWQLGWSDKHAVSRHLAANCLITLVNDLNTSSGFNSVSAITFSPGINYPQFSEPADHPGDFQRTGSVAGYFGSISRKLNIELLTQTATALPNWQFILVGKIKCKTGALAELPNVHFLGPKSDDAAPAYIQNWDVSLLPLTADSMDTDDLVRLKEYMAAGTPVAATPQSQLSQYQQCITMQNNKEPFSQTLQRARTDSASNTRRQKMVKQESWQYRADQLNELIHHLTTDQSCTSKEESLF